MRSLYWSCDNYLYCKECYSSSDSSDFIVLDKVDHEQIESLDITKYKTVNA